MYRPPYRSEAVNIYGDTVTITVPTVIGNECIVISRTGQHRVQDTIPTHINSMDQYRAPFSNGNGQMIIATPMHIPGGVSFTFPGSTDNHQCYCPPSGLSPYIQQQTQALPQLIPQFDESRLQYEIALKQLEQQMLENMLAQTQRREKSYQLMFHLNTATSTADLYPKFNQNFCITATQTEDIEMADDTDYSFECEEPCQDSCNCKTDKKCRWKDKKSNQERYATDSEEDDETDLYPRRFSSLVLKRKNSPPPENFHDIVKAVSQSRTSATSFFKPPVDNEPIETVYTLKTAPNTSRRITFSDIAEEIPEGVAKEKVKPGTKQDSAEQ